MKIVHKNLKAGEIKLQVTNKDDLWYLSQIVEDGDVVSGQTVRKIKIGDEPNIKVIKKTVFLELEVVKVEFHRYSGSLRISGKVVLDHDDVSKGSHHTFDVEEHSTIKIMKEWMPYHLELLDEALKEKYGDTLICVLERDAASFALLKTYGYDILTELEGDVQKKGEVEKDSNFYLQISSMIQDYDARYKLSHIILASPAFWKEELLAVLKKKSQEAAKKVTLATCNSIGKNGVEEVLKRTELKKVLADARVGKELELMEAVMREVAKNHLAVYGFEETHQAVNLGAVSELLVVDELIQKMKEDGKFHELQLLMKNASKMKAKVHILSGENEAGRKLLGLGGIAALLRYKIR